jgi:hypothetical protein
MRTNPVLSILILAGLAAATTAPAWAGGNYSFNGPHRSVSASWSGGHNGHCCYAGGVGVGAAAGLAVGTAVGVAAASRPAYVAPPVVYRAPPPVIYAPPVVYLPPVTVIR